ncbi:WD40 repeat-like protein [Mycena venus]|uniref:WD40 repeat-like protein n=1 Tax=Mycena venus TaxID=2733690 RepID=A0A8H6XW71_9AGAR|nr:WD40 repeat-like protein [Mycena venus]
MFSTIGHAAFRLHDIEKYIVQADIQLYLQHSFRKVTLKNPHVFSPGVEWPSPKDISTLVSRSGALFIYAATVVKFVDATGHSPERRLEALIKSTTKTPTVVGLQMLDSLYMEVLRIAVTDPHSHIVDEDLTKRMQHVVGAVVLLQVPVSMQTLSCILDINPNDVQFALDGVAAMLLIPPSNSNDPIRIFHPSFPDFLLDPKRCSDTRFGVHAGVLHSQLIRRCIVIMNTSLHYDMCDFRDPSLQNAEVKDLPERINRYIVPELLYACKFWKAHLEFMIDDSSALAKMIQSFVLTKLLPWIECLSILSSISVALPALGVAQVWCTRRNMLDEIERLESVRNFVLYEREVAESALHIYQIAPFHPAFNAHSNACLPPDLKVRLITAPSQEWSDQPGIFGRHRDGVTCLAISSGGSKLASGSSDTFVRIWDVEIGQCILETAGHSAPVSSVAFSPDGSQLVTGMQDGSMRVWDVQTGLTLLQFIGHSGIVNSVVYTTDGEQVVSGSQDATIRIWNIESGQEEVSLECQFPVLSLSISQDGTTLVSGSVDGIVRLWDMTKRKCTREVLRLGYSARFATTLSPDASRIAIGRWDAQVSIWNNSTCVVEATLLGHQQYACSVAFSPDGSFVASGCGDGSIRIWEASSGSLLGELCKHTKEVRSVVFSADGRRLFSSSADATIRVWSLFDGSLPALAPPSSRKPSSSSSVHRQQQQMEDQEGHQTSVLSVAFSPDEQWLVSTSGELGVFVWDTKSGKCVTKLKAFALDLAPLSFHPDPSSPTFACGLNKHVYLWDSQTWKENSKLRGHTGRVNCVRFTHDGHTLLSSSEDGTIKLWDNTSKNNTHTLSLPKSPERFDGFKKLASRWSRRRVYQVGELFVDSFSPFPNDTRIAMISGSEILLWDTDHSTPYRRELTLPHRELYELTCTPSDEGDDVYITAMSSTSVLVWNGNGEPLDSDASSPQSKYIRAKQYPNIVAEKSGWISHTKHPRIRQQKLAWIPLDRRNMYTGASATSQSGRLFGIGGHSGLITILDVSAMVGHLAANAENTIEALPRRDGQLEDLMDPPMPTR